MNMNSCKGTIRFFIVSIGVGHGHNDNLSRIYQKGQVGIKVDGRDGFEIVGYVLFYE